jgi:ComF family protein
MASLRRLTTATLDLVFPALCSGCRREGAPLCPGCLPALDARLGSPGGTPLGLPAEIPAPLLQLEWCAPFTGPVRDGLHDLKYRGERRLAEPFGVAVARRWSKVGSGAELVVPVPVHAERERRRGYDQAALIAAVAARELRLPLVRALERRRATVAQFELGHDERATNVAGAFGLRRDRGPRTGAGPGRGAGAVVGRWVLLVDDVVTTGATLAACAQTLRAGGAMAVSAIAVARER